MTNRYYSAEKLTVDDFGVPFTMAEGEVVYDAKTTHGPWGTMTETSYQLYGIGLGTGLGQKYRRQANGEFHKVEG